MDNKSAFNKLKNIFHNKYLKGDGKLFSIVFFILFLLIITGIITEHYIDYTRNNWKSIISEKNNETINIIKKEFNEKEKFLLYGLEKLKYNLNKELSGSDDVFRFFIKEINRKDYDDFSIQIFAPNGKLIGWNQNQKFSEDDLFPLPSLIGETFFLEEDLAFYYSIIDTFHFQSDEFFVFISLPIEKKYRLYNEYFEEISIYNSITNKIQTEIKIDFNPFTSNTNDGNKYSFELLNNKEKKIGLVTFETPKLRDEIEKIRNYSASLQSIIVLIGLLIIAFGLRSDYIKINSLVAKFLFLTFYLILFRVLIFLFAIPSKFIDGEISDPSNYSSTFGFGIVKSPLELLVTNIFFLVICSQLFRLTFRYIKSDRKIKNVLIKVLSVILIILSYPIVLRAFASSLNSIIFDTKLKYFKDFKLLPELTVLIMHINALLIGVSFLFVLIVLFLHLYKILFHNKSDFKVIYFLINVFIVSVPIIIFFSLSKNPLYNFLTLFILVFSIGLICYLIIEKDFEVIKYYLIILFLASVNSVILLNYFDTIRERNSVKNIAFEINRLNEQLIKFYIDDVISNIYSDHTEKRFLLRKDINFNALAFNYWTKSNLHKEELNSFISIYDRYGKKVGEFNIGIEAKENIGNIINKFQDVYYLNESNIDSLNKRFSTYQKFIEQGVTQLIISSGVDFEVNKLGKKNYPDFLKSELNILNQFVNLEKVKIFQFRNNNLVQLYGDVYPNRQQIKLLFETKLDSNFNDAWIQLKFGEEDYEAYLYKVFENQDEILNVVAVAKNKFSWNLFNFFKVFILHSTFILILIITIALFRVKRIKISFKSKLFLLFLFISIIPITILGLYNRNVLNEQSANNIINDLKQKSNLVESNLMSAYAKENLKNSADKVFRALGISFNLYDETNLLYSTNKQFFDIGLMNNKLNSLVYYKLFYDKFKEYYQIEKIEGYQFYSYYKVINIKGKNIILNVNQAFNKTENLISTTEFDIVLFGIYSLMLVIIIFASTILANQISSPIQKLTTAAKALGRGDFNVKVQHNVKGELKELLDGFNKMTDELKRNQIELTEYEKESAWKDMAKQVAHEIRNPLTPMKLALQHLMVTFKEKRDEFDKLFEKVSTTILNQIENLNQIATEFSRIARMPSLKIEEFDLIKLLNELSSIYIQEKISIKIISDLDKLLIKNDKNQVSRVFINLIRNSIQASSKTIVIKINKSINFLEIYFEDDGKGMTKEIQDKIFIDNFSTKDQGMGLGLKISKKFLNSINGDISLISSSEKGTIFKITLPYE
ncbi:MAG: ATP-binding protein [Ignavibacterium sp.]|nr:ATP-binding protein [Ignavibacterium sp.]MDW8375782.1 ATP-binding protein [Ignavibacteriales bacterium]